MSNVPTPRIMADRKAPVPVPAPRRHYAHGAHMEQYPFAGLAQRLEANKK